MIETVSPRPALFIIGSEADTVYYSEAGYSQAKELKKLSKIKGASHLDLYDHPQYMAQVVDKLDVYFSKYLGK